MYYVYLGPTIRGVIQKGAIYPGSRQEVLAALERAIQKYPRIRNLLVSGEELVTDRVQVKIPGTRLNTEYRKLVSEVK